MLGADLHIPRIFFPIMRYVTPLYLMLLLGFWFFQDGIDILMMRGVAPENFLDNISNI